MFTHTLVIGGSRGTGKVIAQTLVKAGHEISVIGKRNATSDNHYFQADLTDWNKTEMVLREIIQKKGKLNHIVFCQRFRGIEDDWVGEIDTSLTGTKNVIEWSKNRFKSSLNNSIVIISSVAHNFIALEQPVSYHVAKAGLEGLIRYYAVTLGFKKIRVNAISPGTILKKESEDYYLKNKPLQDLYKQIIPLGRMCKSEDVADLALFLCNPQSQFITGQNITIDGGLSLQGHESLARELTGLIHPNRTKKLYE